MKECLKILGSMKKRFFCFKYILSNFWKYIKLKTLNYIFIVMMICKTSRLILNSRQRTLLPKEESVGHTPVVMLYDTILVTITLLLLIQTLTKSILAQCCQIIRIAFISLMNGLVKLAILLYKVF